MYKNIILLLEISIELSTLFDVICICIMQNELMKLYNELIYKVKSNFFSNINLILNKRKLQSSQNITQKCSE